MNPPILQALWTCVALALASASIAMTMTQTAIFEPWRKRMLRWHPQLGHLAKCFYCTSHWVVIAGVSIYQPALLPGGHPVADWIVAVFFTLTLATWVCGLMFKVFLLAMGKSLKEDEVKRLLAH